VEGISQLGQSASRLYEVFSEAESVFFSGAGFLLWWSTNKTQFLINEEFVSKN